MKIFTFGEVLWDIYPDKACIGGAPLNFAAHTAKHGEHVVMVSAVGNDEKGNDTLACLRQWNIDTAHIAVLPHAETGKCLVTLDEHAVPSYNLLDHTAWDAINTDTVAVSSEDVVYFGTLALRHAHNQEALCRLLAQAPRDVFVDMNIRAPFYTDDVIRFALSHATILKISDEELPTVLSAVSLSTTGGDEEICRALTTRFHAVRIVLITKGDKGAVAFDAQSNRLYAVDAVKTAVVSTVGAGDSFGAAFLHRYLAGDTLTDCLSYAAKIASIVIAHYDAVPDYMPS